MKKIKTGLMTAGFLLLISALAWAGPYSDAFGGGTGIDTGIPGFVGPDGDGIVSDANYVNPIFKSWATGWVEYTPSDVVGFYGQNGIGSQFGNPDLALGPVTGNNFDIVSLGDMHQDELDAYNAGTLGYGPGSLTLTFDQAIVNGAGADFVTFENGFISEGGAGVKGQIFAELGYVEVSTNGTDFARFASDSISSGLVGGYGTVDPTDVYNLVGKHVNAYGDSWGTPFDLETLVDNPMVLAGLVDLNNINYVRIIDIPGNGDFTDADGDSIYDAWVTWGSGGLDFEALGVINQSAVPVPGTLGLLFSGLILLLGINRKSGTLAG